MKNDFKKFNGRPKRAAKWKSGPYPGSHVGQSEKITAWNVGEGEGSAPGYKT